MAPSTSFRIGDRVVGTGQRTYIIAEIGSNHDGDLGRAKELIAAAAKAGADAVKFQSFTARGLTIPREPAYPILEKLSLPRAWLPALARASADAGVHFLSTPFDEEEAAALEGVGVPAYKIASGDMTHVPLLRAVARYRKPVLLSTGLADLTEVAASLATLRAAGGPPVALLHCVACYPPAFSDMNLRAIDTLAREFQVAVGLSDHTPGHAAVLAAVALGASVIEKHVTFDRALPGPDHPYAITMDELGALVRDTRSVEAALGDGVKRPAEAEAGGRIGGRRSIYAAEEIPAGTRLTARMFKIVRPGKGLTPADADALVGRTSRRAIARDELIGWQDVE